MLDGSHRRHSDVGVVIFSRCVEAEWRAVGMTSSVDLKTKLHVSERRERLIEFYIVLASFSHH